MVALYGRGPQMARVEDVELGATRLRLLVPGERARGVIVYYHGGGWVLGSLDQFDALGRRLAEKTGCAVVLVDYRLAPEHRYPTAVEDAWTALEWTAANLERIAGGAGPADRRRRQRRRMPGGGRGAAGARTAGPEIALQVLVYPVTDCDLDTDSYLDPANQLLVGRDTMAWFWDHYAPDPAVRSSPDASPLRAREPRRPAARGGAHRRARPAARRGRGLRRAARAGRRARRAPSASTARCTASS